LKKQIKNVLCAVILNCSDFLPFRGRGLMTIRLKFQNFVHAFLKLKIIENSAL